MIYDSGRIHGFNMRQTSPLVLHLRSPVSPDCAKLTLNFRRVPNEPQPHCRVDKRGRAWILNTRLRAEGA